MRALRINQKLNILFTSLNIRGCAANDDLLVLIAHNTMVRGCSAATQPNGHVPGRRGELLSFKGFAVAMASPEWH